MSTFNMRIDMGPEEAVDAINGYFEKVATWFVGEEPDIKLPMQVWVDTHNGLIKQRNLENTGWIVRAPISGSWGVPVGTIITLAGLPANLPGWVHLTGTTLVRADYPKLWEFALNSNNIVTDEEWFSQKRYYSFSYGDGETTFRIPRAFDFERGWDPSGDVPMGKWHQDQMQNISGRFLARALSSTTDLTVISSPTGAFSYGEWTSDNPYMVSIGSGGPARYINFNSSNSARTGDETWPCHGVLPKLIYTGEVW